MSENETNQPTAEPAEPADQPTAEAAPTKRRFRDRFSGSRDRGVGMRGAIAVALAGVILGGVGGTALGFALDGGHHGDDRGRHAPPFGRMGEERGAPPAPPNGAPGGMPPAVTPDEDESGSAS